MYYSSYKYKNVDTMNGMMLTHSCLNFIDMPLFALYVFVCIQICSIEVFHPAR